MTKFAKKWRASGKILGLFLALTIASSAQAGSAALAEKVAVFSRIFAGSTSPQFFYHPGYCSSNIFNLYFIFRDLGLPQEEDKIAVIFEQDRSSFVAQNARLSKNITKPQPFTFHVIYISEGQVFDFDHGQEPLVEPLEDYLAKQFPAGGPGNNHLLARIYSPHNYLRAYDGPAGNPLILDRKNLSEKLLSLHSLPAEL